MNGFPIEPCPSNCDHPMAPEPCDSFVSQGFGPEGDFEHSLFCRTCGWERAEHSDECPYVDAEECHAARERSVAGISDDVPSCPEHSDDDVAGLGRR